MCFSRLYAVVALMNAFEILLKHEYMLWGFQTTLGNTFQLLKIIFLKIWWILFGFLCLRADYWGVTFRTYFYPPLVVVFKFIVQFFQCVNWLVNLVLTWQRLFYILHILSHLWSAICHQHQNDRVLMGLVDGCTWVCMMVRMEQMENRCSVDSSPPPSFLALAVQKGGESLVHNFTYRISWKRCHLE